MTYYAHLARHLDPDAGPDHDEDCDTDPCDDCRQIELEQADERVADGWRDERE